jgi:hypothetical protein
MNQENSAASLTSGPPNEERKKPPAVLQNLVKSNGGKGLARFDSPAAYILCAPAEAWQR